MDETYILEVKNLNKNFNEKKHIKRAVIDVSFKIKKGEIFGIIGESGSGKSTIGNILAGFIQPTSGIIEFYGNKIQMIFQDAKSSFSPKMNIGEGILEGIKYNTKLSKREMNIFLKESLDMVHLPRDCLSKKNYELSGGQCQRAAIARAIIGKPDFIICDEITSALDVIVQDEIIDLFLELKTDLKLSSIFISHNIALVNDICENMIVMKNGEIVEQGNSSTIILEPKNSYTKELMDSVLSI